MDGSDHSTCECGSITRLLKGASQNSDVASVLFDAVYAELKACGSRRLARGCAQGDLQTTTLVHEAYIKLFGSGRRCYTCRRHFYFAAARAMRDVIVEYTRRVMAQKRGGEWRRVPLEPGHAEVPGQALELIIDVDEALDKLNRVDPLQAEVVLLRFFGGLTLEQVSSATGRSLAQVRRAWVFAQGWLERRLL